MACIRNHCHRERHARACIQTPIGRSRLLGQSVADVSLPDCAACCALKAGPLQARAEVRLTTHFLHLADVQHAVLWVLGDAVCPRFMFLKARHHIGTSAACCGPLCSLIPHKQKRADVLFELRHAAPRHAFMLVSCVQQRSVSRCMSWTMLVTAAEQCPSQGASNGINQLKHSL